MNKSKIKVKKRDKKIEFFDHNKIISVVKAAGLSGKQAKKLSLSVANYFNKGDRPNITSLQIRDRVLIEIQKMDKPAAKKFIWFEKYKDKNYGVKF